MFEWKGEWKGMPVHGNKIYLYCTHAFCLRLSVSLSARTSVCLSSSLICLSAVPRNVAQVYSRWALSLVCRAFVDSVKQVHFSVTRAQGEREGRGRERERERGGGLGILVGGRTSPPLMTFAIVARRFHDSLTTLPFPLKWFSLRKSAVCSAVMTARDVHEHVKSRGDSYG